jgi:magnesium transporter
MIGMSGAGRRGTAKAGLPPGTLIHIGEKKTERSVITLIEYDEGCFRETPDATVEAVARAKERSTTLWVNVDGLVDTGVIEALGTLFSLHPLTQEDILNTEQRPKIEELDEYLSIVIKMLTTEGEEGICAEQVSLVLADGCVLSFQEAPGDVFESVRGRLKGSKGRIRRAGADYLLYALLDAVVDGYFIVFDQLGERIEDLEDAVISEPDPGTLEEIYALRRDLVYLRRSIWPLREVVGSLGRDGGGIVGEPTLIYFRDVHDHIIQMADTLETYRDMAAGMLDIYLSSVSNRMNEVMKVLTIIATIFIPLTFIAGLYGMNFAHMPELRWELGYPAVLVFMAAIAMIEVIYFRKKGWI